MLSEGKHSYTRQAVEGIGVLRPPGRTQDDTPARADLDRAAPQDFYRLFLLTAEKWPERVAVELQHSAGHAGGAPGLEQYSFSQLRYMAESVGRWLGESGLRRGDRCAFLAANDPRWVAAYLGAIAAGCVAVPLDTAFKPEQVATLLRDSGSSVVFTDPRNLPAVEAAARDTRARIVLLHSPQGAPLPAAAGGPRSPALQLDAITAAGPGNFSPARLGREDLAVLLYTSGTTADPKGVMLTHANLLAESEAINRYLEVTPADAILGVLPLFHALAQMANLLVPLTTGARVVYLEALNTDELMRALRERDITLFACVPQFFYLIHERVAQQVKRRGLAARLAFRFLLRVARVARKLRLNLGKVFFPQVHRALGPRLRYMITGGSRFDPAIGRDLEALGFNLLQAYGLTETSGGATATPPADNVVGSVGKPLHGVEVRIVDPQPVEESGRAEGEIAIRGPIVMPGYFNRPDATRQVLRDGWLYSGDLGYLDERGNLFITGRRKEIIVLSSGKNIYPEEIEAHYLKSPFIREICVLGLQNKPGEPFSERLHAVIVPNFEVLRERRVVNLKEVIRFDVEGLSAQLPAAKRILSYDIWQQELPRTTTRKLKRFEIQKRVEAGRQLSALAGAPAPAAPSHEDSEWLADPDVERAMAVVREAAARRGQPVGPGDNLELDLGLDSMERVELVVKLENELGARVDDSLISEVYTVRQLIDAVRAGMGQASARHQFAGWEAVLATEATDPEVTAVSQPRPLAARLWYLSLRLVNLLARDLFHLQASGLEKLPRSGPFILSPNHQSYLDTPVLVSLLPWPIFSRVFFVGTGEIFGSAIGRRVGRTLRLAPVDPDANLVLGMRAGAYGLRRDMVLVLYPEGERSIDGPPKTFKKGAAILAAHLRVPIYPVALDGFFEAWPRGKFFQKFSRLKIAVGDPIVPPQQLDNPEETYRRLTDELRARVAKMWTAQHAGSEPDSRADSLAAD